MLPINAVSDPSCTLRGLTSFSCLSWPFMQTELDLVETNIIGDFRLLHDHHVRIALASGETHSQSWPLRDIRCRRRRRRRGHVNVDVMNSCNGPVGTGGNDASPRLVL